MFRVMRGLTAVEWGHKRKLRILLNYDSLMNELVTTKLNKSPYWINHPVSDGHVKILWNKQIHHKALKD
jgi:hypothetical protein